jgi:hypothetical protein
MTTVIVTNPASPAIRRTTAKRLVELACRAPSVYNTQPWAWRLREHAIDLYADERRSLPVADPVGRNLVISCGAALHHLQVAARAFGLRPEVTRFPDPGEPAWLARTALWPGARKPEATSNLAALHARCTDRRRFTSWPVPDERLERLVEMARDAGGDGVAVTDLVHRFQAEGQLARAYERQRRDPAIAAELRRWTDRVDGGGVPFETVPEEVAKDPSHRTRFGTGSLEDSGRPTEGSDGLIVLSDSHDTREAWLRCGEGLSALWLHAVREGLSIVPLSQVVEVPETRAALQHDVLGNMAVPLLAVRVGWQAISRSQITPTPRRPVNDVLVGSRAEVADLRVEQISG